MLRTADDIALDAPGMGAVQSTKGLYAEFHMEAEQDPDETEKQARPVFKEVEYVTIRVPGDKDNDIIRAVRPQDKQAWPVQYAAFRAGLTQPVTGTPLAQLPFLTKAQVMEFGAVGVKTAEQLVEMSDVVAQKFMGAHTVRKKVKDFLDAAAGAAPLTAMRSELDKRDTEISVLKNALAEQGKKIEELSKNRR